MFRAASFAAFVALATVPLAQAGERAPNLTTVAEQSGFVRTGRYAEVERLCAAFQQARPAQVRCFEFARSPEGRPMLALAVSGDGALTPGAARAKNRPIVLMQGGIHAGEIDGKDAGFLALRELLEGSELTQGKGAPGVLDKVTFVFVPVFNVDGHERFGRWNRPNQVGPEEMGWRVTSQNLNLNRDYVKAEAPEMHAMLRLLNEWDPILYADLHVTDGAQFQHDVALNVTPTLIAPSELTRVAIGVRDELIGKLQAQGSLPLDFYPAFIRDDDPQSGFASNVSPPRFSQEYWAQHNRIGVLVETHSWKNYATRVRITHNCIIGMLELAAANGTQWLAAAKSADTRGTQVGGTNVVLSYANTDRRKTLDFLGYEYTREPSAISGGLVTRYDPRKPQVWHIPLFDAIKPGASVVAPRAGYLVPAGYAALVGEKLALHGIEMRKLGTANTGLAVQTFRATKASPASQTFENRTPLKLEGAWAAEKRDLAAGSLYVPIAQAKSLLAMTLLEPASGDSLVSWGFFNSAFEQKEYLEAYVAEDVAKELLKKDPALRKEFEQRLNDDPAFAASAAARLNFFFRRSPSWDERLNLYPVYRVDTVPN